MKHTTHHAPVTFQIQLDPETLNTYDLNQPYLSIDSREFPKLLGLMNEFVAKLQSFGYVRAEMYTGQKQSRFYSED